MSNLCLTFTDLCAFHEGAHTATVLLPYARHPESTPAVELGGEMVAAKSVEAHYPVLEFNPADIVGQVPPDCKVLENTWGKKVGLWFFREQQLTLTTKKRTPRRLTISEAFKKHVVSLQEVYDEESSGEIEIHPDLLSEEPNGQRVGEKRVDARLVLDDGYLTVSQLALKRGTGKPLGWQFKQLDGGGKPALKKDPTVAVAVQLTIPSVEEVEITRRDFGKDNPTTLRLASGSFNISLHLRNSPFADLMNFKDEQVQSFELKRAKHFQLFSDRLIKSPPSATRVPWSLGSTITSDVIHCPLCRLG